MPDSLPPAWQVCGPKFPKKKKKIYIYIYIFSGCVFLSVRNVCVGGRLGHDRFSGESAERGVVDGRRQCRIERWIMGDGETEVVDVPGKR